VGEDFDLVGGFGFLDGGDERAALQDGFVDAAVASFA